MITVAFTVSGLREQYLRETLDSWAEVRGVQDAHLLFQVEPGPFPLAEFARWAAGTFASTEVVANPVRLSCIGNTRAAVESGLARSGFVVLAEEDILVSRDVLEYFRWARDAYAGEPEVVAACAHTYRAAPSSPPDAALRVAWFSPLVWGTWRREWQEFIAPGWAGLEGNDQAWDLNLRLRIATTGRQSLFPARSRSRHTGRVSSITSPVLSEHFYAASQTDCWAQDYPARPWREISQGPELGVVV